MIKTLALCMVVKNEAKGLKRAVESCLPFVQNVYILVDDSSNDGTYTLAGALTKNVSLFTWKDNFSDARNMVAENVKEDFILFIDGHEYVEKHENLQSILNTEFDSFFVRIKMDNGSIFEAPRIYKRGVKFDGNVHETLLLSAPVRYQGFLIVHDRLGGQAPESAQIREKQRDDQVPRLLGSRLKKNPADTRASFHLINFALSKNEYKEALSYTRSYLKHSDDPEQRWYVYYVRSLCFLAQGSLWRAYWAITHAEWEVAGRWETQHTLGVIYFERKKYEKALKHFVASLTPAKEHHMYEPLPLNRQGTWNLMGEAFFRLGIYDKASTAFERASEHSTDIVSKDLFRARADLMAQMDTGRISYKYKN